MIKSTPTLATLAALVPLLATSSAQAGGKGDAAKVFDKTSETFKKRAEKAGKEADAARTKATDAGKEADAAGERAKEASKKVAAADKKLRALSKKSSDLDAQLQASKPYSEAYRDYKKAVKAKDPNAGKKFASRMDELGRKDLVIPGLIGEKAFLSTISRSESWAKRKGQALDLSAIKATRGKIETAVKDADQPKVSLRTPPEKKAEKTTGQLLAQASVIEAPQVRDVNPKAKDVSVPKR